jgi:hypothetical protein
VNNPAVNLYISYNPIKPHDNNNAITPDMLKTKPFSLLYRYFLRGTQSKEKPQTSALQDILYEYCPRRPTYRALNPKYQDPDVPGCDDMYSDGRFG